LFPESIATRRAKWKFDSETSLYYYRARYYDPGVGRFLSEDPVGFGGGENFYRYVYNSPVGFADPMGLSAGGWPRLIAPRRF